MWVDYVIYVTTGVVLLAVVGLVVVAARNRGSSGMVIGLTCYS